MAGSADNAGPRDEQGKLIRFPRSSWVPKDGVEPLTGESGETAESTTATVEAPRQELEAFEADDFWASGDTQQFVGTGGSSPSTGAPVSGDAAEPAGASEPALAAAASAGGTAALEWRSLRVPMPTSWIAAVLVAAALAATGVVVVSLTSGTSPNVARHSHATVAHVVKPAKPWVARSAKPRRARRHVIRPRPPKPASSARSGTSVAASGQSVSSQASSTPAPPSYQAPPAASAASDSGSSSGGGSASSSSSGSAGPTSPLGPGTSPSG